MTAEKDPRVEAVAKLLFIGPLWGFNEADWESWTCSGYRDRALMAAEDVLRGIDEAAEFEYRITREDGTTRMIFHTLDAAKGWAENHPHTRFETRRAPGQWEAMP